MWHNWRLSHRASLDRVLMSMDPLISTTSTKERLLWQGQSLLLFPLSLFILQVDALYDVISPALTT